jgi:hypothetical protein
MADIHDDNPSPAGANGRSPNGRFSPGNAFGRGNPLAKKAQQFRTALSRAATVADVKAIAKKMIELAKAGDIQAAKLVFDRLIGPVPNWDVMERLENLDVSIQTLEAASQGWRK